MKMHNPPHPGEIIRDQCLEPLGLTVTASNPGKSDLTTMLPWLQWYSRMLEDRVRLH